MIFAAFNGAAFVHMFLTAPETKGKTLEEMDEVFDVSPFYLYWFRAFADVLCRAVVPSGKPPLRALVSTLSRRISRREILRFLSEGLLARSSMLPLTRLDVFNDIHEGALCVVFIL